MNGTESKARAGVPGGWEARANAWMHLPEAPMDRSYGRCRATPQCGRPRPSPRRAVHATRRAAMNAQPFMVFSHRHANRLHLGIHIKHHAPVLAPEPRLLEPAE